MFLSENHLKSNRFYETKTLQNSALIIISYHQLGLDQLVHRALGKLLLVLSSNHSIK